MNKIHLLIQNKLTSTTLIYIDFTNPIKRKEFDRQRKKQQMREMQNVSECLTHQHFLSSDPVYTCLMTLTLSNNLILLYRLLASH